MRIGYCHQGYELTLAQTPGLPKVRGEAEMIKQCLINLIKNSVEAMPQGGRIDVTSKFVITSYSIHYTKLYDLKNTHTRMLSAGAIVPDVSRREKTGLNTLMSA